MSKESKVRDKNGKVTHIRVTSDDGKSSKLYKKDNSLISTTFFGGKGERVEVAEHEEDGTTKAYEADNSLIGSTFFGGKGKKK